MSIHSFLKVEKDDPDWQFSPEELLGKEFKIIDAHMVKITEGQSEKLVLRQTPADSTLLAKRINIQLEINSQLDLLIINDLEDNLEQVFLYNIHLMAGSALSLGVFTKGGKLNKHIIQVSQEECSGLALYGVIDNRSHGDTEVITKVAQTDKLSQSNQMFFMISGEMSQTVFQTNTIANNNAVGGLISLEANGLQGYDCGRCFSKIDAIGYANQVNINKISTVSSINKEKINYMQNRGFTEAQSRKLLIDAFINQSIEMISDPIMRDELKNHYMIDL